MFEFVFIVHKSCKLSQKYKYNFRKLTETQNLSPDLNLHPFEPTRSRRHTAHPASRRHVLSFQKNGKFSTLVSEKFCGGDSGGEAPAIGP